MGRFVVVKPKPTKSVKCPNCVRSNGEKRMIYGQNDNI